MNPIHYPISDLFEVNRKDPQYEVEQKSNYKRAENMTYHGAAAERASAGATEDGDSRRRHQRAPGTGGGDGEGSPNRARGEESLHRMCGG